ncbi:MAG TPA: HD domain-containing protein [Solirubrobacteraceae bacterium]|jgi:(p)ppGpp synthase/HD superfamily hydrolase|nr:HD domain-containing protein [Solirubrobacteraceae bacterium]
MSLTDVDLSFVRDLPLAQQAIAFARERHGDQRRDADGAPFLVHPLEVAALLERSDYPDHVVAAAVLHDVLENTDVEAGELKRRFGPEVCHLVDTVSDDMSIEDEEARKADARERVRAADRDAAAVFAADKISKVRELRMLLANGKIEPLRAETKLRRYRLALEMLEEVIPGSRLVEILRFELESLESLPPSAGDQPD